MTLKMRVEAQKVNYGGLDRGFEQDPLEVTWELDGQPVHSLRVYDDGRGRGYQQDRVKQLQGLTDALAAALAAKLPPKPQPDTGEYPEHEKLAKVQADSQAAGEFYEWLMDEGYVLGVWTDGGNFLSRTLVSRDALLAKYLDIDLDRLEAEKRTMLAQFAQLYKDRQ